MGQRGRREYMSKILNDERSQRPTEWEALDTGYKAV